METIAAMPVINLIVFIVGLLLAIIITSKCLKGKCLKLGKAEISDIEKKVKDTTRLDERQIIKRQIHIARAVCSDFKTKVPSPEKRDPNLVENICYRVADVIEDLILFNHISTEDDYLESRFPLVWDVISSKLSPSYSTNDYNKLKNDTYNAFCKLIELLLNVRKERE